MYCSECKLRVADDSVVTCPVCQGPLQVESETEENPESIGFAGEFAAAFDQGQGPDQDQGKDQEFKLEDKLDAYVRDDSSFNSDFNPEVLGLKSLKEESPAASADDIRVLADLWEKEDIGADLDGVFADAFNVEDVPPDPVVADPVEAKPEKSGPTTPVMPPPDLPENPRKLGLPLLVFIILLVAVGGGWFYMQSAGVKPENKITQEIKSPAPAPVPVEQQTELRQEPAVVSNEPIAEKVTSVAASGAVVIAKIESAGDETAETSAGDNRDSFTEEKTGAVAPAGSAETEVVAAGSQVTTSEALVAYSSAPPSKVEKKTLLEPAAKMTVENQKSEIETAEKVASEPVAVKEKVVAVSEKVDLTAVPAVTATGPRYVVHIGSFRREAGAARQLAKLQKKGFTAYKVEVDLGAKGVWQRIFVPGGVLKSDARVVQEQLAKSFPREESLVRKIKK